MTAQRPIPAADPAALPAVRCQIEQAQERLQIACAALRGAGWTENADELARDLKRLRIWTQPGGWLSYLERQP